MEIPGQKLSWSRHFGANVTRCRGFSCRQGGSRDGVSEDRSGPGHVRRQLFLHPGERDSGIFPICAKPRGERACCQKGREIFKSRGGRMDRMRVAPFPGFKTFGFCSFRIKRERIFCWAWTPWACTSTSRTTGWHPSAPSPGTRSATSRTATKRCPRHSPSPILLYAYNRRAKTIRVVTLVT